MFQSFHGSFDPPEGNMQDQQGQTRHSVTMQGLPKEILDYIFSFLSIKERIRTEWVCRNWTEFGKNYKWSWPYKLDGEMLEDASRSLPDHICSAVLSRCGTSLRILEVKLRFRKGQHNTTTKVFEVIGTNCKNLTELILDVFGNQVEFPGTDWSLIDITRGCTKLKRIIITLFPFGKPSRPGHDCINLCLALKECRSLEYLKLDSNSAVIDEGCLDAIGVPLKGFKIWASDDTDLSCIAEKLLQRRDNLEELGLHWHEEDPQIWPIMVVRHYENTLTILSLHGCNMRSSKWCEIPATQKNLQVLSLKQSYLVEDNCMKAVADNCKKLRVLNISGTNVSDVGVTALAVLPNLKVLDASLTLCINGEGMLSLAACGNLEKLYFANTHHFGTFIETSCMTLANFCPNLSLLNVSNNINITQSLVDVFHSSSQRGFFNGHVSLYLMDTVVDKATKGNDNLHLIFDEEITNRDGCLYTW